MPLLPVAAREARSAARSWRNYAWRTTIALIGLALIPTVISTSKNPAFLGRQVFHALTMVAFFYAVIAGVLRTADSISDEKRENTLGLLFLTDLKAYDILAGKLLASTATIFFGLLAILPLLTIPLLMGGVTAQQLILCSIALLNTLFLSISIGFLMSTLLRQSWAAVCMGLVAMFFLVLVLPRFAAQYLTAPVPLPAIGRFLLLFSPSTAFEFVLNPGALPGLARNFYWFPLIATHLLAWLNIFLTLHYLPIVWRDNPRNARAQARWKRIQTLRFGGNQTRTKFRKRLLKSNPLFWLAGREQVSSTGLMAVMVCVFLIALFGDAIFFGLVTLHLILLARMASASSHHLAEDRKSGALELLLATSLSVRDVLRGRWMALGRQFFGPILIVSLWHFFAVYWLAILGRRNESSFAILSAFPVAFLAWIATVWSGMWFGLRARTPTMATWITFTVVLLAPAFFLSLLGTATGQFSGLSGPDSATAIVIGLFLWAVYLSFLSSWSANRLRIGFRAAATDRFSEILPYDWRPVRRFASRFAILVLAISALVFVWRWTVNFRGERSYQRALAGRPEFARQSPDPTSFSSEKNLARWDFFPSLDLNAVNFNRYYIGRARPSLREIIRPYYSPSYQPNWTLGRCFWVNVNSSFLKPSKRYEEEFVRLHAAATERPFFRFYQSPQTKISPTPMESLHDLQRHLCLRAGNRMMAGQRPLDDALLALRFATAATNYVEDFSLLEPMILQAIQPVYDGIVVDAASNHELVKEVWTDPNLRIKDVWTDQDLLAIQQAYEQIDLFLIFDHWRFEITRHLVDFIADRDASSIRIYDHPFSKENHNRNALPGRIRLEQVEIIKFGVDQLGALIDRQRRTLHPTNYPNTRNPIIREFQAITHQPLRQTARAQTAIDQVVVACAIERFRRATGHIPQKLSELIPKYLQRIPNDIVLGQPLKYQPKDDQKSYLLYSIGFDRIDHQGSIQSYNGYTADWSWICKR